MTPNKASQYHSSAQVRTQADPPGPPGMAKPAVSKPGTAPPGRVPTDVKLFQSEDINEKQRRFELAEKRGKIDG